MPLQFVKFELDDLEGLHPAFKLVARCYFEVGRDFAFAFSNCFRKKTNILMSILDAVKRSLQAIAQIRNFHEEFFCQSQFLVLMIHAYAVKPSGKCSA